MEPFCGNSQCARSTSPLPIRNIVWALPDEVLVLGLVIVLTNALVQDDSPIGTVDIDAVNWYAQPHLPLNNLAILTEFPNLDAKCLRGEVRELPWKRGTLGEHDLCPGADGLVRRRETKVGSVHARVHQLRMIVVPPPGDG